MVGRRAAEFARPRPWVRTQRPIVSCKADKPRAQPQAQHPRVRRVLEANPELAADVHAHPGLEGRVEELLKPHTSSSRGSKPRKKEAEHEAGSTLCHGIMHARNGGEVAGLLRSGVQAGVAGPRLVTAALDRLRDLHQRRRDRQRKEASSALMAACREAMEQGLACLPQADPWMLVAMARTPYKLRYHVAPEQQRRITDAFIAILDGGGSGSDAAGATPDLAGQEHHAHLSHLPPAAAAVAVAGPAVATASAAFAGGTGAASAGAEVPRGQQQQQHSNSEQHLEVPAPPPSSAQHSAAQQQGARQRDISNFVWATFSNRHWEMSPEQRAALMRHVRLLAPGRVQHHTNLLVALVRLKNFAGLETVSQFIQDGTVGLIVDCILAQPEALMPQHCQDTLLSMGRLKFPVDPNKLVALLEHTLAVVNTDARPVNLIAKTFKALALLYRASPERYTDVLRLPAVRELCEEFLRQVDVRVHTSEWSCLLQASAQWRYDAPVGDGGRPLADALLSHLPAIAPHIRAFDAVEALMGLGAYYGVPEGGRLAPELQPHRAQLAGMARLAADSVPAYFTRNKARAFYTQEQVTEALAAFAACGMP